MTPDEKQMLEDVKEAMQAKGIRQEALAASIGVSQTTIWKMLTGRTKNPRYLHRAAIALGVSSPLRNPGPPLVEKAHGIDALQPQAPFVMQPKTVVPVFDGGASVGLADLPVYGSAESKGGCIDVGFTPIDTVRRPELLATVRDSYALLVAGDGMRDAIRSGDRVYVNPHLMPRIEDLVVIYKGFGTRSEAIVREYRGQTDAEWRLRQSFPAPQDLSLSKEDWSHCHVIVTIDRR